MLPLLRVLVLLSPLHHVFEVRRPYLCEVVVRTGRRHRMDPLLKEHAQGGEHHLFLQ